MGSVSEFERKNSDVWMPPYIWMMFGCPLYIHNTKKGYFVRQRRCPHAPIHLHAPCT